MSYIGAEPTTAAFPFDQFSGNGSTTAFTLTYAPASATSIIVAISGVMQNPNLYSVVGTTLTFSPAPPTGTNNISVLYLGLPVIGSSSPGNTAFLSSTDLTATAGQTVFASAGSYTPGFVQVYRNGARLGNADFTATNGTTITLANAATAGDLVTIEYYTLTSLTNALPLTGGTVTGTVTFNSAITGAAATFSGNVGIGTTTTTQKLNVYGADANNNVASFTRATGSTLYAYVDTGANVGFFTGSNAAGSGFYANATSNTVQFNTNGSERARIDSSGNLLVGLTSSTATPAQGVVLGMGSGSAGIYIGHANGTSSGNFYMAFSYNGSAIGSITQNGTTGVLYNLTSDYRLKNNPQALTGAKDFIMALQPKKWQWWDGSGEGVGFIAHEFMEVAKYSGNGIKDAVDADGKPVHQSIQPSSSEVMANLVAFIQEQQALITQLQADVAALKGQA